MTSRYPHRATPAPTKPPPVDGEQRVERAVKRIEPWQKALAIVLVIFAAGGTSYSLAASKADVTELHQVRDGAAAALGAAQANTSAQLGTLQATVQDLRTKQATLDANLAALTATAGRLTATTDVLYLQLVEIARTTGARQVPAPAPSPATHPP